MFKFIMPDAGEFRLDAVPYNVGTGDAGSDLDMQVTIYNSAQTALGVYNPGTLLNSVIDTTLSAGIYYIKVEGKGNVYAPSYASLGSYSLQGRFTGGTPLAVRRLELHGKINGENHQLSWIIDADEPVVKQIIETSTDGVNFSPLVESDNAARSYSYNPNTSTTIQYRLNVTFNNGRQYYSNVVTLKQTALTPRPQLAGTLVTTNSIVVNSPGNFSYTLYDFNARIINRGQLSKGVNNISAAGMPTGMYMIRFDNGDQQWTDKLVRQ
jgi:hypothetical protein